MQIYQQNILDFFADDILKFVNLFSFTLEISGAYVYTSVHPLMHPEHIRFLFLSM